MSSSQATPERSAALEGVPVYERVIAEFAAASAIETDPPRLVLAFNAPLALAVPEPVVTVGLVEGDEIVYPNPLGETHREQRLPYYDLADELGQVVSDAPPPASTTLHMLRVQAVSLTPCTAGGRVIAYLVVGTTDAGYRFSEGDLRLFKVLAQIAGPAVERAWQTENSRDDAAAERTVASVAAAAAAGGDPGGIVRALRNALQPLVEDPFVAYGHYGEHRVDWFGVDPEALGRFDLGGGDEPWPSSGSVQPAVLALLAAHRVHRFSLTPVTVEGTQAGMLLTGSLSPRYEFTRRARRILTTAAQIVGPAVLNALATERLRERAEEDSIVASVAGAAARESEPKAVLRAVKDTLRSRIAQPFVAFAYVDGNIARHLMRDGSEAVHTLVPLEEQALVEGQAFVSKFEGFVEPTHPGHDLKLGPLVIVATHAGGKPRGLLAVASRDPSAEFTARDLRLVKLIAEIVGPAMENVRSAARTARERAAYELVLENLDEAVVLLDDQLSIVFANMMGRDLASELFPRWSRLSLSRRLALLPPDEREGFESALEFGVPARGRFVGVIRGRERWLDYEILPVDHPEYRVMVVCNEVTSDVRLAGERRRQQEQMEQAARLAGLGELVGGVAHELNNPLTAILGFSELLLSNPDAAAMADDLNVIVKEAIRARNIVRDLLFLTRPGPVESHEVSLDAVVAHVRRLRTSIWQQKGIRATFPEEETGLTVLGNENQLVQVVLNLVSNAEHAIEEADHPSIDLSLATNAAGNAVIEVRDNGSGMDEATRSRIFEPFFTTKQGAGTGLGLSLCLSMISSHGGTMEVTSEPGVGSTFVVSLPLAAGGELPIEVPLSVTSTRKARVLVIDDEPNIRAVAERVITSIGHEVNIATDADSALVNLGKGPYDLVLCDYRLGADTAETIIDLMLRESPESVARTVIVTGATTDAGVMELARDHGLRVLPKPFSQSDITKLIDELDAA